MKNFCPIKVTIEKTRAGRVAQVVQHLPSKCEGMSSNPVPAKKKDNK
jgi:hypothetical protein